MISYLDFLRIAVFGFACLVPLYACLPLPPPVHAPVDSLKSYPLITNYRPLESPTQPSTSQVEISHDRSSLTSSAGEIDSRSSDSIQGQQYSRQTSQPNVAVTSEQDRLAEKNKGRVSIFSVIHPALHAAFSAERAYDKPQPPSEPLTKVEYRSTPLRGTEMRDRTAIGLSPGAQPPRAMTASDERTGFTAMAPISTLPTHSSNQYVNGNAFRDTPALRAMTPNEHIIYASSVNAYMSPSPQQAQSGEVADPTDVQPVSRGITPPQTFHQSQTVENKTSETPSSSLSTRSGAFDAVESAWRRIVSSVKNTFDSVLMPPTPSPDFYEQKVHRAAAVAGPYMYTQQDIDDLVDDIMHQIQIHQGDMKMHRDMLKNYGHWDPHDLTKRERETGVIPPMLVMRTSVLVSPDVLADAVTASTKKLLLSKATPLPWSVTSRLLVDVHSRLANLLEPVGDFSSLGSVAAPSPASAIKAMTSVPPPYGDSVAPPYQDNIARKLERASSDIASRVTPAAPSNIAERNSAINGSDSIPIDRNSVPVNSTQSSEITHNSQARAQDREIQAATITQSTLKKL